MTALMSIPKRSKARAELLAAVLQLVRYYRTLSPNDEEYNSDLARYVRAVVSAWDKHPERGNEHHR
jgi:hypothetical protein